MNLRAQVLAFLRPNLPQPEAKFFTFYARMIAKDLLSGRHTWAADPVRFMEGVQRLIRAAPKHRPAWDACSFLVEMLTAEGSPIPVPLAAFIACAHRGEARRPPAPKRKPSRDYIISMAVRIAVDGPLHIYRNSASPTLCACDLVSDCLVEIGDPLTYDGVARVAQRTGLGKPAGIVSPSQSFPMFQPERF